MRTRVLPSIVAAHRALTIACLLVAERRIKRLQKQKKKGPWTTKDANLLRLALIDKQLLDNVSNPLFDPYSVQSFAAISALLGTPHPAPAPSRSCAREACARRQGSPADVVRHR